MQKLVLLRFGPVLIALSALGLPQTTPVWVKLPQPAEIANDPTVPRGADRIGPAGTHRILVTSSHARRSWLTPDDGKTWEAIAYPSGVMVEGGPVFIDDDHAWAAGAIRPGGAWLASTSDRAKTWNRTPVTVGSGVAGFSDIQFLNKEVGIAVGVTNINGLQCLFGTTHDGGITWAYQSLKTVDLSPPLTRVRFQSSQAAWAVGGQSIYSTIDGGASWHLAHTEPAATLFTDIAVVKGSGIFVVGGFGLLLRSRDFGATWERVKVPPGVEDRYLSAVGFADERRGWVGGDKGIMIETDDGGETWGPQATGVDGLIRGIEVIDGTVYAVGDEFFGIKRRL
jgi:photosystem II stability/assembly factor-like uncharacterized protein